MNIRKNMKHWSGLAIVCLTLSAASTAMAANSYEINFSGSNPLPTSGTFAYDPTTATFSGFTITWDSLTFDLTNAANNPAIGNAAPACVGSGTPGSQTFALLSGACDGPAQVFTGWEALDDAGVSYFEFETEIINGIYYDSLIDAALNQGQGSTGDTRGTFSITPVPEPSTTCMFICGLAFVALGSRKNFRRPMRRLFSVCAAIASAATLSSASTISYVDLYTTNTYNQTSGAQPTVSGGYSLTAHLHLQNPGDFSAANVTVPGGTQPPNGTNNGVANDMAMIDSSTFQYQSPVLATAAFNNEFPSGDYTFTATGSPNQSLSISWGANPDYSSSVPYVTDYASLQGMNSANDFALTLNPFTNALPGGVCDTQSGSTCSYIFLSIYDTSGNAVFSQDYAPNSTTSFDILGGTLQPRQTYTYSLIFSNQQVGSYNSGSNNWVYNPIYWSNVSTSGTFSTAASVTTPEPSTMGMFMGGLALIVLGSRKTFRACSSNEDR